LRLFSFGGYGLALAALALVVFGAYDNYSSLSVVNIFRIGPLPGWYAEDPGVDGVPGQSGLAGVTEGVLGVPVDGSLTAGEAGGRPRRFRWLFGDSWTEGPEVIAFLVWRR